MPIYEYECPQCGVFEVEQRISEDPLKECPECKARGDQHPVQRIISASAFHLKGGGWYKSDYSKKSPEAAKNSGSDVAVSSTTTPSSPSATSTDSGAKSGDSSDKKDKGSLKAAGCGGGCTCH